MLHDQYVNTSKSQIIKNNAIINNKCIVVELLKS